MGIFRSSEIHLKTRHDRLDPQKSHFRSIELSEIFMATEEYQYQTFFSKNTRVIKNDLNREFFDRPRST